MTGDGDNVRDGPLTLFMVNRMDQLNIRKVLEDNIREICHLSQMQVFATSIYQKNYFQMLIDNRMDELILQLSQSGAYEKDITGQQTADQEEPVLREFTMEELAEYNGEEGRPVYVAVNQKVYDLSSAPAWAGGRHNNLQAGQDLSSFFQNCHMGFTRVLEKYPLVGTIKEEQ